MKHRGTFALSFLSSLFARAEPRQDLNPLYARLVEAGRDPAWYVEGRVPDTLDGRFDMIAAMVALALLRLEREGKERARAMARLTELFIDDMEGSIRQMGIGDLVVSKHLGRMVSALGGRLAAFRAAPAGEGFEAAVRRNIFHEEPPSGEAVRFVAERLERFERALAALPAERLVAGEVPAL